MSKDLNKVTLTGRLGKDPEIRITPQGNTVTYFTVASNRTSVDRDGQKREDVEWFNVVAWNKLGELCGEYLRKGSRVLIEGRLQTRAWEDQESGQKRSKTEVIANDMIMLDSKRDVDLAGMEEYDRPKRTEAPTSPPPAAPAAQPPRRAAQPTASSAMRPSASGWRRPPVDDDEDLPF